MGILETLGYIIVGLSVVFMLFGVVGIFRFKDSYTRILVASKIDTMGVLTLIIGMGFIHGASFFTAKLVFIMAITLFLNPLVAHIVARSAYTSGHPMSSDSAAGHDTTSE